MHTMTKKLMLALAVMALAAVSLAAKDFPKGSPKFQDSARNVLNDAKKSGKPIIMVFSAVWCGPCQIMKNEVYPSAAIKPYHDKFEWAYLDTDDRSNAKVAEEFGVRGIPHIQILDSSGKPVDKQIGSTTPESFAKKLEAVLAAVAKK